MNVTISIAYSETVGAWSWEVSLDGATARGYESDYGGAEEMARGAALRMGARI